MRIAHEKKKDLNPGIMTPDEAIGKITDKLAQNLISNEQIDAECKQIACIVFPGTTVSICCITMKDGSHIVGGHIFAPNEVFIESIGQEKAVRDARIQVADILVKRANEKYKQSQGLRIKGEADVKEEN